jgi:branched-chain amino acid transport system substrate-binding protein
VPQLFVATGATKWNDPRDFPWTMGFQPNYQSEGQIYAKYILKNMPNAKIAILYQNDDYGKDYVKGMKDGLGAKAASMIVAEESYETTEPTIDSHIVNLKASGADLFFNVTIPKFAAQAIKKAAEIEWKPTHFLNNVSSSISATIKPAGVENAQGIISSAWIKDPTDPQWKDDPEIKAWNAFLDKYYPEANRTDANVIYGYVVSQSVVHVLKNCGDDLTRENVMKQAASLHDFTVAGLLPGIKINTSPSDFAPVSQMQLMRLKGDTWERFGDILNSDVGG